VRFEELEVQDERVEGKKDHLNILVDLDQSEVRENEQYSWVVLEQVVLGRSYPDTSVY
jgi:hypothetical protein